MNVLPILGSALSTSALGALNLAPLTEGAVLIHGVPGVMTANDIRFLDPEQGPSGLIYTGACYGLEGDAAASPDLLPQIDHALGTLVGRTQAAGSDVPGVGVMVMGVTNIEAYRDLYSGRVRGLGSVWKQHMRGHFPAMGVIGLPQLPGTNAQVGIFSIGVPLDDEKGTYPAVFSGGGKGYRDVVEMGGAVFSGGIVGWSRPPQGKGASAQFPDLFCDQMLLALINLNDALDLADAELADTRAMLMFVTSQAYAEFNALAATGDLEALWNTYTSTGREQPMPPLIVVGATALVEPVAKVEIFAVANSHPLTS